MALVLELDPALEPRAWTEPAHKLTDGLPCPVGVRVGDSCTWSGNGRAASLEQIHTAVEKVQVPYYCR